MFTNTKLAKSVKLACAVSAASTLLMPSAVFAQDSEAAVERISVTGSRILKSEFSSSRIQVRSAPLAKLGSLA